MRDCLRPGLPAHAKRRLPRLETGESLAGPRRSFENHGLWLRQETNRQVYDDNDYAMLLSVFVLLSLELFPMAVCCTGKRDGRCGRSGALP